MRRFIACSALFILVSVTLHACSGAFLGVEKMAMRQGACEGLACAEKGIPGAEGDCADHCLRIAEAVQTAVIPSVSLDAQPIHALIAVIPPVDFTRERTVGAGGQRWSAISRRLLAGNAMLN